MPPCTDCSPYSGRGSRTADRGVYECHHSVLPLRESPLAPGPIGRRRIGRV